MLNFLKQTRKFINAKEATCIVLGNESCDLDSAASALCLAYFYQEHATIASKHTKAKQFLPVLNIPKNDYSLKTEVKYLFNKYGISETILTFRDELHQSFIASNDFILVDHHVSPFNEQSIAIYDHRPKDTNVKFPPKCYINIDLVGSCATLVADAYLSQMNLCHFLEKFTTALHLLRSTIILDTVNFSSTAGRFTERDQMICCCLEECLGKTTNFPIREEVFQSLCTARKDISNLRTYDLLRKDLKFVKNINEEINIALPGFPIQVQNFIKKQNAKEAIEDFAKKQNVNLILLLGMYVNESDGAVERDIGLINVNADRGLYEIVEKNLIETAEPNLNLERYEKCNFMEGHYYKQVNVKATRKHILPIVKQSLEMW